MVVSWYPGLPWAVSEYQSALGILWHCPRSKRSNFIVSLSLSIFMTDTKFLNLERFVTKTRVHLAGRKRADCFFVDRLRSNLDQVKELWMLYKIAGGGTWVGLLAYDFASARRPFIFFFHLDFFRIFLLYFLYFEHTDAYFTLQCLYFLLSISLNLNCAKWGWLRWPCHINLL